MNIRTTILYLTIFLSVQILGQNTNPVVSNVAFAISGTEVTVTYDVDDAEQGEVTINMKVSDDGGTTYKYYYGSASGDIGSNITVGTNKIISWTYNNGTLDNYIIKIIANDETEDGENCGKVFYDGGPNNDGNGDYYNTIQIGDQCWLKEHLNVGTMIPSNSSSDNQMDNNKIEKYCVGNDSNNCVKDGGLYQWDEAMKYSTSEGSQGICPPGWHIPTLEETRRLRDAAGGRGSALRKLGGVDIPGVEGTNTSGFTALYTGYRSDSFNGAFLNVGYIVYYWSSTESDGIRQSVDLAVHSFLNFNDDHVGEAFYKKKDGLAVRCLKD